MASVLKQRPLFTATTALTLLTGLYYVSKPSNCRAYSDGNPPAQTLSKPKTMFFSRQMKVVRVQELSHDTKRITFELPGGMNEVSGVKPGAAVLTQHTPEGAWLPVFRPYTPIHDLNQRGIFELLVKKYPNGRASTFLHRLTPGQELTVRGPHIGHWTVPRDRRDVIFIAGGAGIAPIYSLTRGILSNPKDKTCIQLLWGVNSTEDIVLREELEALERKYPDRLRVTYAVSNLRAQPGASNHRDEQKLRRGYVDKKLIQEAIGQCKKDTWGDEKGQKVFICGPPGMENALAGKGGILAELGVTRREIHRF